MKLQGIFVPIVIPFDHNGALYKIKVQHNVEKWNRAALTGYVVCGDEGIYLSSEEKIRVWQWVAEHAAPEKILLAAASQPSVHETVELANRAETMGYKAIVVRGPSAIYFRAVADRTRLPVIVDGDLPEGLDAHPNVIAYIGKIGAAAGIQSEIQRWTGSGATVANDFAAGAAAAVLSFANAAPYAAISIWEAHRTRDTEAALDWQQRIAPAVELVTEKYGIPGLKYAMDLNGYYGGPPRLPLVALSPSAQKEIDQAFDGIRG